MIRRDVERIEVRPLGLGLRSFGDVVPHGDKDIGHAFHERGERMSASDGGTTHRQGDVDRFGLEHPRIPLPRENHLAFF